MADRTRVGIIGTSWWVDLEHLPGLSARGDVEVTALCGRDEAKARALAAKHGVRGVFTDWRALLASGIDAVVIATPNALHHPQALAALDAGLHVICEKPLALDAARARHLAARARATGRAAMTFFTHRGVGAAALVKRLAGEGVLGRLLHVSARYLTGSQLRPGKPASWKMIRAEAGSGALGDIGSHVVDLVRWWTGDEVASVAAAWQTARADRGGVTVDADDEVAFLARLRSGALADFHASKLVAGRGNWQRVELHGEAASLAYEADPGIDPDWEGQVWVGRPDRAGLARVPLPEELRRGLGPDERAGRAGAYRRLTDPFFEAARRGGGPVEPGLDDGAAVQAVLDAVARSADERRWVAVA